MSFNLQEVFFFESSIKVSDRVDVAEQHNKTVILYFNARKKNTKSESVVAKRPCQYHYY